MGLLIGLIGTTKVVPFHKALGIELVLDAVGVLLDYGVGEDFGGYALDYGFCRLGGEAFSEGEGEVFALAGALDSGEVHLAECILDGLALRVENRGLQSYVDMSLHFRDYSSSCGWVVVVPHAAPLEITLLKESSKDD